MSKKRIRKTLHTLIALASVMTSHGSFAKIPPKAFKGVSRHFCMNNLFFDLTLGEAALETGLIYNLRFYGNFTHGTNNEGNRHYIDDKSDDPLWKIVHILFPSSGGSLSVQTSAKLNFGYNVDNVETIALLMNYVNELRKGNQVNEEELNKNFISSFHKEFKLTAEELQTQTALKIAIVNSMVSKKELPTQIADLKKEVEILTKIKMKTSIDQAIMKAEKVHISSDAKLKADAIKKAAIKAVTDDDLKQAINVLATKDIHDDKAVDQLKGVIEKKMREYTIPSETIQDISKQMIAAKNISLIEGRGVKRADALKRAALSAFDIYLNTKGRGETGEEEALKESIQSMKTDGMNDLESLKSFKISIHNAVSKLTDAGLNKDINTAISKIQNGKATSVEKAAAIQDTVSSVVEAAYNQKPKNRQESFEKDFPKLTLNPLLGAIKSAIDNEKDSLYPDHTVEQILSAFFCAKFNTQQDIWELLKNLDDSIIKDKTQIPTEADYLKEEDLPKIAQKMTSYQADDVFNLLEAPWLSALTPYKPGVPLISNGKALPYDRASDTLGPLSKSFPDCQETVIDQIMKLLLFDYEKREYNLAPIEQYMKAHNIASKNFGNFKKNYEKQDPITANNGDIETRSYWNRVMGDLNTPDDPVKVIYKQDGKNEMRAGFVNFVNAVQKIFGIKLEEYPSTGELKAKKEWLETSLETIFTAVNPTQIYTFYFSDITLNPKAVGNDLCGDVDVTVMDDGGTPLYSYRFHATANAHSDISNLKILKEEGAELYDDVIQKHPHSLRAGTAEESLWALSPNQEILEAHITHPIYSLFDKALSDNDSKIQTLKTVGKHYDDWKKKGWLSGDNERIFKTMLSNILGDVSWNDRAIVRKISPVIKNLFNVQDLHDVLKTSVKAYRTNDANEANLINSFTNLEHLNFSGTQNLESLPFTELKQLQKLELSESDIKDTTNINKLTNLKYIDLSNTSNFEDLSIKGLNKLYCLSLFNSHLKTLSIEGSEIEELKLQNATSLKHISLKKMIQLNSLTLPPLHLSNIESLDIDGTKIDKFFLRTTNAKTVSLSNMTDLSTIVSFRSEVETLTLKNLPGIRELYLVDLTNLKKVVFEGDFSSLTKLSFTGSKNLEHIEGLNCLSNLKNLDLRETTKLSSIAFEDDHKDLELNIKESGVKKSAIRGIGHLDEDLIF